MFMGTDQKCDRINPGVVAINHYSKIIQLKSDQRQRPSDQMCFLYEVVLLIESDLI